MPSRSTPSASSGVDALLAQLRRRAESGLEAVLPEPGGRSGRLHEAMRYAVFGAGKRLRPILVYAAGRALGNGDAAALDPPAAAVELIHAYSLVHDDLPGMDNDDWRRGRPTCHRAFDEPTALLVGDALQTLAFEALAADLPGAAPPAARIRMVAALAEAAGSRGMAGGQAIDLAAVGRRLSAADLEEMHLCKTAALIRASVRLGGLACDPAADEPLEALDRYARCIGLAFQIRDDILDVEGDSATLGKTSGADAARDKPTYPSIVGLAESKQLAETLADNALAALEGWDGKADLLRELAGYCIDRGH